MNFVSAVGVACTAIILAALIRVELLGIFGRIRLTDWLGYTAASAGAVALAVTLPAKYGLAGGLACVAAILVAFLWTFRDIRRFRTDPELKLTGAFVVGRAPKRVSNWPGR